MVESISSFLAEVAQEWVGHPVEMSPVNPLQHELRVLYVGLGFMTSRSDILVSERGKINDEEGIPGARNAVFIDVLVGATDERGRQAGGRYQGVIAAAHHEPRSLTNLEERINDALRDGVVAARADYYARLALSANTTWPVMDVLGRPRHEPNFQQQFRRWRPNRRTLVRAMNAASALLARDERIRKPRVAAEVFSEHLRFANSEGAAHSGYFHGIRFHLSAHMYDDEGRLLEKYASLYTVGNAIRDKTLLARARRLERLLKREYNTAHCPLQEPGVFLVLLDHGAAHACIHEATTHPLELLRILQPDYDDASYAPELGLGFSPESFGTRVAARGVSLRVDPGMTRPSGEPLWATAFFDLEGTRARQKELIRDGILVGAYATRADVERLRELTGRDVYPGDARFIISDAETSFPPAYPRQSNTVFQFTNADGAEYRTMSALRERFLTLLKSEGLEYGLLLSGTAGETDGHARGSFYPTAAERLYADGRRQPVKGVVMHMNAQHFLRSIVAAGGGERYSAGLCGLGTEEGTAWVRIGMRNPALIIADATINTQTLPCYRP